MALLPVPHALFVGLVLCTAVQRLRELLRSHTNQRAMRGAGFARQDSSLSYYAMVTVHASWLIAALTESSFWRSHIPSSLAWAALALFLAAQALRLWAIQALGTQWNVNVMTPTPEPRSDPATPHVDGSTLAVVRSGPYAYVRHPNYLAVILEFATLPLIGGALGTACVWSILNGAVLWHRIRLEERYLRARPGYYELTTGVPLLIPSPMRRRTR